MAPGDVLAQMFGLMIFQLGFVRAADTACFGLVFVGRRSAKAVNDIVCCDSFACGCALQAGCLSSVTVSVVMPLVMLLA
jgi:hypothetical protein